MKPIEASDDRNTDTTVGFMRSRAPRWLHALSLPYGLVTQCRNILYDWKWLPQRKLPCRVVSVGNLTLGGTGKTPVAIFVTETLLKAGHRVAVLSRGYRRRSRAPRVLVSDGHRVLAGPDESGDEPFLIAQRCPKAIVAVGADRYHLGCWVLEQYPIDCIVLDDGFQHRALARDVDLLLIDATDATGLRDLVPAGRLGISATPATLAAAGTGTVSVDLATTNLGTNVTGVFDAATPVALGATRVESKMEAQPILSLLREATVKARDPVLIRFAPHGFVEVQSGAPVALDEADGRRAVIFSGIGNAEAFRTLVQRQRGITVADAIVFPDHHVYTSADMGHVHERAERAGASLLVTTEKDAVKLRALPPLTLPVWAVRLETDILEGKALLERLILSQPE